MTNIILDDGYRFGIGVFETIAVENKKPIFLDRHMRRLEEGIKKLRFHNTAYQRGETVAKLRSLAGESTWRRASVKIIVSPENIAFALRENPYAEETYRRGAALKISDIFRNESSPLTYYKTINYAENYLEKAKAVDKGYDEVIFLNSGGILAEGAVSNIFCVSHGMIYTPAVSCGLLDGVMRQHVMEMTDVKECAIMREQLTLFDEFFITNSLMGIMPVRSINGVYAKSLETGTRLQKQYLAFLSDLDKQV